MKQYIKFAGLCAFVLGLVAFILVMATPVLTNDNGSIEGMTAIFGKTSTADFGGIFSLSAKINLAPLALIGWILALVALLALAAAFVLPLVSKSFDKFGDLINLCAAVLLIVAGIFFFFGKTSFASANNLGDLNGWGLGGGWIASGILAIVAGLVACVPFCFNRLSKR